MKIPSEVQCKTCSQVFCCAKCRQKHEDNYHQEMHAIRQICYICNNRPFPLRIDTKITPNNLLIEHILKEHLPLRCNRCTKVFHTAADFKTIARCHITDSTKDNACHLERSHNIPTILESATEVSGELENKENIDDNCSTDRSGASSGCVPTTAIKIKNKALMASPQVPNENRVNFEEHAEVNEAMLTPLSMINLRWKRKSRQSFDSLLSTTNNISAVNASESAVHVPSSPVRKLARTTSTPMIHGCLPRLKGPNESYTCAMGQMSSIHSNSGSESDSRSDDITPASSTSYEMNKVRAIIRSRSKVAATPLRQVMSKSIQRAIAQHGYYSKMLAPGTQRKMSFNSTASSGLNSTTGSPSRAPLDLRTTPVLKRSSSDSLCGFHNKTKTEKSLEKARSDDSSGTTLDETNQMSSIFYDTHQNTKSLNDSCNVDQENSDNHKIVEESLINQSETNKLTPIPNYYQDTPKMAGGILKKVISFTSPEETRRCKPENDDSDQDDGGDVWSTPSAILPRSYSCSVISNSRFDSLMTDDNSDASDDVFLPPLTQSKSCRELNMDSPIPPNAGKIWTIVSNVIRLASGADEIDEARNKKIPSISSESDTKCSMTLAQKAASFASFLTNHFPGRSQQSAEQKSSSESDDLSLNIKRGGKRRRTTSIYGKPYETIGNAAAPRVCSSPAAKRKRIQARQPIERMRQTSWK